MLYFKIQTNRASIMKLLAQFRSNLIDGERLVAPRPLQGQKFRYYYAFARVDGNSRNLQMVAKYKNCEELSEQEFESQQAAIPFMWRVEKE